MRFFSTLLFLMILGLNNASAQTPSGAWPSEPTDCQNVQTPGQILGDQVVTPGQLPTRFLEATPATQDVGRLEYQWMVLKKIGNFPAQWYPIMSATEATYQPGMLTETTQFARCVRRAGCNTLLQSNSVTVTVSTQTM
jgi:hypothetical protein